MSAKLKVLVAFMAMATVAELAAGKTYTIEWAVSGNYCEWSSMNTVLVGDTVVFTYGTAHTVDELSSEVEYEACSFVGTAWSDNSGNTTVTFDAAGTRYFACAAGPHCILGQKVAITVVADSPSLIGDASPVATGEEAGRDGDWVGGEEEAGRDDIVCRTEPVRVGPAGVKLI